MEWFASVFNLIYSLSEVLLALRIQQFSEKIIPFTLDISGHK